MAAKYQCPARAFIDRYGEDYLTGYYQAKAGLVDWHEITYRIAPQGTASWDWRAGYLDGFRALQKATYSLVFSSLFGWGDSRWDAV